MRVAVVGTGFIANLVAPGLPGWGFPVTYVVSTPRSIERARALASGLGARATSSYEDVLASPDVDAVYLGIPNNLHYRYAKAALEAGKHVILEKPMASNYEQAKALVELAERRALLLFDATTTFYQPNYQAVRRFLPRVGTVKLVTTNYSQYSSRYDRFKRGDVAPVFDPGRSGGALMDLGHYCLSWICGLFGEPEHVTYLANVERGIDTSGMALLDYGGFKAVAVTGKDCGAPSVQQIEGTEGYIVQHVGPNTVGPVTLHLNDGTEETFAPGPDTEHYAAEFGALADYVAAGDDGLRRCQEMARLGLVVSKVQTEARRSAGILFPDDEDPLAG